MSDAAGWAFIPRTFRPPKAQAMDSIAPERHDTSPSDTSPGADTSPSLAMAVIASSRSPLLLLDENLTIVAASHSFCSAFGCELDNVKGESWQIGAGEWDIPQIHSLLRNPGGPRSTLWMDLLKGPKPEPSC